VGRRGKRTPEQRVRPDPRGPRRRKGADTGAAGAADGPGPPGPVPNRPAEPTGAGPPGRP
ncbi:hypothetical protein ACFWZO_20015, partial [Streptomyces sp. NPDC059015]